MKLVNNFLDQITMYKLLLYYLIFLVGVGVVLSFLGILHFSPIGLIGSSLFLVVVCYITNRVFSWVFDAPTNTESVYITALILALIATPIRTHHDLPLLGWMGVWAMASKFIFAVNKKHIFNPAAAGAFTVYLAGIGSANWWVGTSAMLPFALIGILIPKKIRRMDLLFYFLVISLVSILGISLLHGSDPINTLIKTFTDTPIIFLAFVMLTEPLTSPPTKFLQGIYGAIVGFLFTPQLAIGNFAATPEMALIVGNVFSYFVSPKYRLDLKLTQANKKSFDIIEFVFPRPKNFKFTPGQYMEWTLPHKNIDSRGNRRYFTIASSPTEDTILLGVRFYEKSSSYKSTLASLAPGGQIIAGQLAGDFVLPADQNKKLAFIGGGIGITPFRSIIKYIIDTNQKRDVVLFYTNRKAEDIIFQDVFDTAQKMGMRIFYVLTENILPNWKGLAGHVNAEMIKQQIPDWQERTFYISGSPVMVDSTKNILKNMGVGINRVITDYFPGYV